jgi:hypothetical protein
LLIRDVEFSKEDLVLLIEELISKYAIPQSRTLFSALNDLLHELYEVDPQTFLRAIMKSLDLAISRVQIKANATSSYFTLLDWVNQVLCLASQTNEDLVKNLPDLVRWQALLLFKCLAESKKRGLKVSALRTSRACLRRLFKQNDAATSRKTVESYIKILVGSKTSPFASAIALGMVAGVAERLRDDVAREVIETLKGLIYDFFIKEIIGSRARVPSSVMVPCLLWRLT